MSFANCPNCGERFESALSPVMPFCSLRCQQLDLRLWLNEERCLPVVPRDEEEAEEWLHRAEQSGWEESGEK